MFRFNRRKGEQHGLGRGKFVATVCLVSTLLNSAHLSAQETMDQEVTDLHREKVEDLLNLMGIPAQVDEAAEAVVNQYSARMNTDAMAPAVRDMVEAYENDLRKIVIPVLNWNGLKTTYIYSYSKRLSPAQVEDLIRFYQSDTGRHFVSIRSASAQEIAGITQHLIESDVSQPLAELQALLRDGMDKYRAATRQEPTN